MRTSAKIKSDSAYPNESRTMLANLAQLKEFESMGSECDAYVDDVE